jgi:hypothetical protein
MVCYANMVILNLGCLHPVARVISVDDFVCAILSMKPSTETEKLLCKHGERDNPDTCKGA